MDKKKNIAIVLTILAGGCAIAIGGMFCKHIEVEEAEKAVHQVHIEEIAVATTEEMESVENTEVIPQENAIANPYAKIFTENEDIVGWITIADTNIDYPVMQKKGDNDYYLYRDYQGNDDKNGCLILDEGSWVGNPSSTNLLIHGHNMKSGAMFGELDKYADEGYAKEHPMITLHTVDGEYRYEVIAAFYSQVYYKSDLVFKYYNFFDATTEDKFDYFYEGIKELAIYDTEVTAEYGDNFITLSTCAYHVEDGRFVVVGKEIERAAEYLPIE